MRQKDIPSALLLFLIVGVASQRLAATQWTGHLGLVSFLAAMGAVLGVTLGISLFRRGAVSILVVLYSLVGIPFIMAGFLLPENPWLERMSRLGFHLLESLSIVAAGEPLEDPLLLLFIFTTGFWFIGLSSGYWLARKGNFLGAVLPSGIIIIVLLIFDSREITGTILTFIFFSLVLMLLGRMNYTHKKESWRTWSVFPTGEARSDINFTILVGTIILVITAWVLPVSSRQIPLFRVWWQGITRFWQRNENWNNLFAGLDIDEGARTNNFYGPYLALGDDAPTSDAILFHAQNNDTSNQERYYWRVRSYDTFSDGIWGTNVGNTRSFSPSNHALVLPDNVGVSVEFKVIVVNTRFGALVTPPRPSWVDRPSRLTYLAINDSLAEPIIFQPNEPVLPGEEYLVQSFVYEPTEAELRLAGTGYPEWVTNTYLQLPSNLAPTIINLANQITLEAESPFDKAEAITAYLRKNISYTTHMESVPDGQSLLTWFLFDYKQGFCNYYATAEVILLRAAGVPARFVVGFSEGEFEMPGWYTVRQQDAHAWPEVYFPGYGWVEFEPTTTEPELVRTQGEVVGPSISTSESNVLDTGMIDQPGQAGTDIPPGPEYWFINWPSIPIILLIILVCLLQVGYQTSRLAKSGRLEEDYQKLKTNLNTPLWINVSNWLKKNALSVPGWIEKRAWLAGLSSLERAFNSIFQTLREFTPAEAHILTPQEAAGELIAYLPEARGEIMTLVEEYQPAFYGTGKANLTRVLTAAATLRNKAHQAHPATWVNKRLKRSKFVRDGDLDE